MRKNLNRIIVVLSIFVASFIVSNNVFADSITDKWTYTQYYNCAKNNFSGNVSSTGASQTVLGSVVGSSGSLSMPSGYSGYNGSSSVNCQTLMTSSTVGLKDAEWNSSGAATLLDELGYGQNGVDAGYSASVGYDYSNGGTLATNAGDGNGTLDIQITKNVNSSTYSISGSSESLKVVSKGGNSFAICNAKSSSHCTDTITVTDNKEDLERNIRQAINDAVKNGTLDYSTSSQEYKITGSNGVSVSSKSGGYVFPPSGQTKDQAARSTTEKLSGMSLSDLDLTDSERYKLYYEYLKQNGTITCGNDRTGAEGLYKAKLKTTNGYQDCEIAIDGSASDIKVETITMSGGVPTVTTISLLDVIQWFGTADEEDLADVEGSSLAPADGTVEQDTSGQNTNEQGTGESGEGGEAYDDDCYNAGVDGVTWIACPALTNLTYTANGFDGIIDDMLQIKTEYYDTGSGAFTVWSVMRNVANVAVILILLVIIASQITGYGIDNYGIKKMLPKLIVMAVVINLSFVLCELIIDASNIVGVGLRSIFGAIGQSMGNGTGKGIGEIISVLVGIAGAAGAAAGTGIAGAVLAIGVVSGPMVILMCILALLGVIISLLLFFAALGIRLMLVIVCVGVAPVAIVCYILPNTKKAFDRWWSVLKACLIVYPICGALMGISELIKGIAWSNSGGDDVSGVAMKLVALVAPYLPFFLLPTLLRGAISALGNVSGAINGIGNRVRGVARAGADAARGTETFKDATQAMNINRQNEAAQKTINKLRGKPLTDLSRQETRRLARAYGVQKSIKADDLSNQMALVNEMTNNGENETELFRLYDQYLSNNNTTGAVAVARIAGRRKDTAARFMDEKVATTNNDRMRLNETHGDVFNKVAKEIATGDGAKNYRSANGIGFEYASQINAGTTDTGANFKSWAESSDNIANAAQHHITSRNELMGMKGSALTDLDRYVHGGVVDGNRVGPVLTDAAEVKRIEDLASQAIINRNEAGSDWDSTKAEQLAMLSGGRFTYNKATNTFTDHMATNGSNGRNGGNGGNGGRPYTGSGNLRSNSGNIILTPGNGGLG